MRDAMTHTARGVWQRIRHPLSPNRESANLEELWALKDINFEVQQGERIGIIGCNGAGKSTLLKILSRITTPTTGRAYIRGRVSSLLEVGTGFHPELTGRENIFLNGVILGMTRQEIKRKFDEIVAFAELEKFLDTPVKRYSSGMYVRLAFAVAAHLEPEILLVDEVLAVGDAAFQKKCLGKMEDVGREGRTVLFVSHNMGAINQLCNRGILLKEGILESQGDVTEVTNSYLMSNRNDNARVDLEDYTPRGGNGAFRFVNAALFDKEGAVCQNFSIGDDITVSFNVRAFERKRRAKIAIRMRAADGLPLCDMINVDSGFDFFEPGPLERIAVTLKDIRLYPGSYYVGLYVGGMNSIEVYDAIEDCLTFNIIDGGNLTTRRLPRNSGLFFWTPEWRRGDKL